MVVRFCAFCQAQRWQVGGSVRCALDRSLRGNGGVLFLFRGGLRKSGLLCADTQARPEREPPKTMLHSFQSTRGMVTSPHHLASQSGLEILKKGGTALEAVTAMAATLCAVYPHMTGMGGMRSG